MSKEFIDWVNKYRNQPLPDGDSGHDLFASEMALMDPATRQQVIDAHDATLPDNPSPRQFADHFALGRKLKAAHAAYKRVGR
jgi:hypothetical protein